jgi:hypothetical protein
MKRNYLIALACFASTLLHCDANDDYENGVQPLPHMPLPSVYNQYQILPDSISPDKTTAFIYPRRSVLYDIKDYGLYLVALRPFNILAELPVYSNLAANAENDYKVNWAANSSGVVMIEDRKWGPAKVFLIMLDKGVARRPTDLTAEVFKIIDPFFKKAHPQHFNDSTDYILDDDFGSRWEINDHAQVVINCAVTNDPNFSIGEQSWTARFQGVWDITKGKFIRQKFSQKWGIISDTGI